MYSQTNTIIETEIFQEAQKWLFDLECQGREARRIVDGILVAVYNTVDCVIYWLADMETGEEFLTTDFYLAVEALIYAVG